MSQSVRIALALLLAVGGGAATAQRNRRVPAPAAASAGAYKLPAVTFHGVLKEFTAKTIVIESDDGQPVTIYRNRKTRFLNGESPADPKSMEPGMKLTIDVAKNPDASLLAVSVMLLPNAAR